MNLNEIPTPITDEFERATCDGLESALEHARDLERQLAEAEKQRDTLAAALRNLMAVIDSHDIQTEDCDRRGHLYCDCLHRARKPALTALATLDQREK